MEATDYKVRKKVQAELSLQSFQHPASVETGYVERSASSKAKIYCRRGKPTCKRIEGLDASSIERAGIKSVPRGILQVKLPKRVHHCRTRGARDYAAPVRERVEVRLYIFQSPPEDIKLPGALVNTELADDMPAKASDELFFFARIL